MCSILIFNFNKDMHQSSVLRTEPTVKTKAGINLTGLVLNEGRSTKTRE